LLLVLPATRALNLGDTVRHRDQVQYWITSENSVKLSLSRRLGFPNRDKEEEKDMQQERQMLSHRPPHKGNEVFVLEKVTEAANIYVHGVLNCSGILRSSASVSSNGCILHCMCVADDSLSTVTATPWIDFVHDAEDLDSTLARSRTSIFTATPVASSNVVSYLVRSDEADDDAGSNLAFPRPMMMRGQNPS
jgi:hypothetical protein